MIDTMAYSRRLLHNVAPNKYKTRFNLVITIQRSFFENANDVHTCNEELSTSPRAMFVTSSMAL